MIEAIELEVEDVVLTSGGSSTTCTTDSVTCSNDNTDDCTNELL